MSHLAQSFLSCLGRSKSRERSLQRPQILGGKGEDMYKRESHTEGR